MLLNIKTGYNGILKRAPDEIVILVTNLHRLRELGIRFIFTNQHAYPPNADFYDDLARLDRIDWTILQNSDFKRDLDDPGKVERYQAEALVHQMLPMNALVGIACNDAAGVLDLSGLVAAHGLAVPVAARPRWYF
jgi:hypothetical protein